jgi:mRNA interferase MazF
MSYIPERGDLVWLNFNPQAGHEQAGRRPALPLSPLRYHGLFVLGLFLSNNQSDQRLSL